MPVNVHRSFSRVGHDSQFILRITLLLGIFIYFQQVFVVNIGGSFKIYDLLALSTCLWLIACSEKKIYGSSSLYLFLFFCVFSCVGYFYFYFLDDSVNYYIRFPEAKEKIRFNKFFAPLMVYAYCFFTWACINAITGSRRVYFEIERVYRYFVVSGTIIAIYALYGMIFVGAMGMPDIVPNLMDHRNSQPEDYALRTIGFSSEPGQLAPILSWTVLYAYYAKNMFSRFTRLVVLVMTGFALLFTFSSSLLAFLLSWCLFVLAFSSKWDKIRMLLMVTISFLIIIIVADHFELLDMLEYFFLDKFKEFIDPSSAIGQNSGVQRAFTSLLGLEVFKNYPIFGVGAGNSYFFLHTHENQIHIWADMLTYSTAPQNSHSMILAEMGIIGYLTFIIFYFSMLWKAIKEYRKSRDQMVKAHIIGTLATFGFLFSVYPIYSFFLWFNIALLMNGLFFSRFYVKNNN
jgi:O-antigen ligase